jgi:hypothetical protein
MRHNKSGSCGSSGVLIRMCDDKLRAAFEMDAAVGNAAPSQKPSLRLHSMM